MRVAEATDAEALSRLSEATFRETFMEGGFGIPYPPEDVAVWAPKTFGADVFAARIAGPDTRVWIGETADGVARGYAVAGPCQLPHPEASTEDGELRMLYVARAAQGTGLGARLFDAAIGWLERSGPRRLWLGVWSGNDKAQHFYAARGFATVGAYQYAVGNWRDDEFIMRRG